MKSKTTTVAGIAVCLAAVISIALAAEDKYTVKAPNGVAFSEFRGYESWENVAVSVTDDGMNAILANPTMIKAYKDGIPGNGKPFPEGSMTAKIEWKKKQDPLSPYSVLTDQPLAGAPIALPVITKSSVPAFGRALAMEYVADWIRFNTISPGVVDTPMHANDDHELLKKLSPVPRLFKSRKSWMPCSICNRHRW